MTECDSPNGGESVKLARMDSMFKVTKPDCEVLHHLFRPAAMVAAPEAVLTAEEDEEETGANVIIVTEAREALWWNMDTLKTNAPDRCSKDALFDMVVISNTKDERCVSFKSKTNNQYLVVTYDSDQMQFKFKLSDDPDEGVTSTFYLGTTSEDGDEPNFLYLRFQDSDSKEWCYWYVDKTEGEVKVRKADSTEIFNTRSPPCCASNN